jgi:hypothetical protein
MVLTLLMFAFAALTLQGCLLFTTSVNSPPTVSIVPPTVLVTRGAPIPLTAAVSDPDGDVVTLAWSTGPAPSTGVCDPSQRPAATSIARTFEVTFGPNDAATLCVFVLATDVQGATAVASLLVSSLDRPPNAVITVVEPTATTSGGLYPLYSIFHLSAAKSNDPDGDMIQNPIFKVVGIPPAATPTPATGNCPGPMPSPFLQCLDVGGFAGTYTVSLTVGDGLMTGATMTTLMVDYDHPACVSATDPRTDTSPLVLDPSLAKTFAVTSILDDGAPWPSPEGAHATPTFAWKVRRNAGTWQAIVGLDDVNALTLAADTYATGDVVDVSVTISDGVAMHLQPACDPQCPAGCPQTAQWTVNYR